MNKYLFMLATVMMITGCGGSDTDSNGGSPPIAAVSSVEINPPAPSLTLGDSAQMSVIVKDINGRVLTGRTIVWSSADPNKLPISTSGQVQAMATGEIEVTATVEGKIAKVNVMVNPLPSSPIVDSVVLNTSSQYLPEGSVYQLQAAAYDSDGNLIEGRGVSWLSSNQDVASVSAGGLVTILKAGSALINVKIDGKEASCAVEGFAEHEFNLIFSLADIGEHSELYSMDINLPTTQSQAVFPIGKTASHASPSPDGTKIAFVVYSTSWESQILIADRNGDNHQVLVSIPARNTEPAWSKDGNHIAFSSRVFGEGSHIWLINVDGSGLLNLTADQVDNGGFSSPSWSPTLPSNETRITYHHTKDGFGFIWTMKGDGSDKIQLTNDSNYFDDQPDWSPDGMNIVFQRSGTAIFGDLYLISSSGGNARSLTIAPLAFSQNSPKWSPDGNLIAFTSKHDNDEHEQIWTIWADGTRLAKRTFEDKLITDPNWISNNL